MLIMDIDYSSVFQRIPLVCLLYLEKLLIQQNGIIQAGNICEAKLIN
jgi:hypothetical protein